MSYTEGQDWEQVVFTNRGNSTSNTENAVPKAKKLPKSLALDLATEAIKIETAAPLELRTRIQQARTAKGLTQAKLAQALNLRPTEIQAFEAGKAKPDNAILNKMSRVLGAKLTGKAAGKKKPTAKTSRAA